MRKFLSLALMLIIVNIAYAQSRAFIVNESFDDSSMPEGWYFTGEGAENFNIKTTNNAGGDPNELHLKSSPFITNGIHLVMASANLTNVESVGMSFKHYLDNYQQSSTIGIATSSDDGNTWNTGWSKSYSDASSSGQYSINETFTTSDFGKDNVLFCLFFEGNTYNINHWYFDDIMIFTQGGNEEGTTDLQLLSIDVNSITQSGEIDIRFTVNNSGDEDITSFEASYSIDGYESVTETFNTDLAPSDNQQFTFINTIGLLPGTYTINIDINNVNGETDAEPDNNHLLKEFKTYLKTVQRTPMIEHFSSSTCGPCVHVDEQMSELTANNPGKYTYTKYPVDFPGMGDPYATDDCITRSDYYEVISVPTIALDAQTQMSAISQNALDERLAVPSYVDIVGTFDIVEDNTIKVIADIISYIDLPDVRVFLSINEKTTTGNVGSNGATEFHHIFMKMLGGIYGIETNLEAGHHQRFEFTFDMSETNMEEIDDLEVAAWVQNYDSKEMYNSSFLHEYSEHLYPVQNLVVEGNNISWDAPEQGSPSGYNVYVNNELLAESITSLSYSVDGSIEIVSVEVVAIYGDNVSIGITNVEYDICETPGNVTATEGDECIEISWDAVDGVSEYQLYRNSSLLTTVSSTTYTDSDIEIGTMYCYSLRSVCGEGNYSAFSDVSCAQVGEKPCDAPENLNAIVEQDAEGFDYNFKVTLSWDAAVNAENYAVYLDGEFVTNSTTTSHVIGFDEEGEHYFTVATICENGESEQSDKFEFELIGVSLNEYEKEFVIYPNPAKDFVKVSTVNSQQTTVRIYNILGMLVEEIEIISNETEINVSDYNPGIYFFNIQTEEGNFVKRIIVE
ncbi:MAG: T9SS type A sorting domain-containing protein [Bacteroidales bacterium]|nr:T9SS type A sorting domain-containing protein [Bacteroidales bacterium]